MTNGIISYDQFKALISYLEFNCENLSGPSGNVQPNFEFSIHKDWTYGVVQDREGNIFCGGYSTRNLFMVRKHNERKETRGGFFEYTGKLDEGIEEVLLKL
jgi:hypothetical protein